MRFKDFSIFSSGGHLVYRSGTILAILVGSHLGNIPMKFELHWPKGSGGVSFQNKLLTTDDARRTTLTDHNSSPYAHGELIMGQMFALIPAAR